MKITINVPGNRRIMVNFAGGYHVENHVDGPGWVVDNECMTDAEAHAYVKEAAEHLNKVVERGE